MAPADGEMDPPEAVDLPISYEFDEDTADGQTYELGVPMEEEGLNEDPQPEQGPGAAHASLQAPQAEQAGRRGSVNLHMAPDPEKSGALSPDNTASSSSTFTSSSSHLSQPYKPVRRLSQSRQVAPIPQLDLEASSIGASASETPASPIKEKNFFN